MRGGEARIGARVAAPFGSIVFCRHNAAQCKSRRGSGVAVDGGRVVLTPDVAALLRSVNANVNRAIRPVAERGGRNADHWTVGGRAGDCEDFALAKRAKLIARGFPSSAALIATADTWQGAGHAVLVVRTDKGDFVLDSKTSGVVPFSNGLYRWRSIQSPDNPRVWQQL
jgi:predicted transglutaminase-like cysteine proteinase